MMQFDHMAVDARDVVQSARFLADILGANDPVAEGADDDMMRVDLDDGGFILFSSAEEIRFSHVAFRVDRPRFGEVLTRLRAQGIQFGNDHSDTQNGRTQDMLGGPDNSRIYFTDANGHLWEIAC
jgi:catechol 2,3-dioxygenase-like lactoylglutathione lyase family enzyme